MRFPPFDSWIQLIVPLRPVDYLTQGGGEVSTVKDISLPSRRRAKCYVAGSNPALSAITTGDFGIKSEAVRETMGHSFRTRIEWCERLRKMAGTPGGGEGWRAEVEGLPVGLLCLNPADLTTKCPPPSLNCHQNRPPCGRSGL